MNKYNENGDRTGYWEFIDEYDDYSRGNYINGLKEGIWYDETIDDGTNNIISHWKFSYVNDNWIFFVVTIPKMNIIRYSNANDRNDIHIEEII